RHRAARQLEVLTLDRLAHVGDGDAVRLEAARIDLDADLTLAAAEELDAADAALALEAFLHLVFGELRELLGRAGPTQRHVEERRRVRIELLHARRVDPRRELAEHAVDAVADLLRRHVR